MIRQATPPGHEPVTVESTVLTPLRITSMPHRAHLLSDTSWLDCAGSLKDIVVCPQLPTDASPTAHEEGTHAEVTVSAQEICHPSGVPGVLYQS